MEALPVPVTERPEPGIAEVAGRTDPAVSLTDGDLQDLEQYAGLRAVQQDLLTRMREQVMPETLQAVGA